MKCVILAGGRGTRISEESHLRPKPMVEIGGRPILWHIMKHYSHHGVRDFIICLGYRGYMIKEYFANYFLHNADVTVDLEENSILFHDSRSEPWKVTLVDTGEATLTGGRVLRVRNYLDPGEPFFLTYGDGLADVDLTGELQFHRSHGRMATMTVVRPPGRFGSSVVEDDDVVVFAEKEPASGGLINGGFFVMSFDVFEFIAGDDSQLEKVVLEQLASVRQLKAWEHRGFWQPMDTLREKEVLEAMWVDGKAPWRTWP
ncbi:MAG: glucose-1-phosphate cytidylyltransferase [Sulfobacillus sp.]